MRSSFSRTILFVLVLTALLLAIFAFFIFVAVVIGLHQAHPTDLALQRPGHHAALARRVVGLHVRRSRPVQHVVDLKVAAR